MLISNTGNVGIGTGTTPSLHRLHVNDGSIFVSNLGGSAMISADQGALLLKSNNNNSYIDFTTTTGSTFQGRVLYNNTTGLAIYTNAGTTPKVNIDLNGKVVICNPGTIYTGTPGTSLFNDYKLYVEKGIITEKLKVALKTTADWADYVFDSTYVPLKIDSVESYIKANKHLPNMPSADEVVETGIDVAKMDALLLRQIEELWLQIIDLKKENERLKELLNK